jgi:adenylate cyclase class IV
LISEHIEIEAKLAADKVSLDDFKKFVMKLNFEQYITVTGPDSYYERGDEVVRHRMDQKDGRHELTVKKRYSDGSTRNRLEIDLHFPATGKTKTEDVDAFLKATGYTKAFTLVKEAHIFWVKLSPSITSTLVVYSVWNEKTPDQKRRYVEAEIEKGSDVTVETAKRQLSTLVKNMQQELGLKEPLNESLWEIFSTKRYQLA